LARTHGMPRQNVPDEVFMIAELRKGSVAACTGIVRYDPPVEDL